MSQLTTDIDIKVKTIDQTISDKQNIHDSTKENIKSLSEDWNNFFTKAASSIQEKELPIITDQKNEKIIFQIEGNILDYNDMIVNIGFPNGLSVNFPREMFVDPHLMKYGQAIKYIIKSNSAGYRYQEFHQDLNIPDSNRKDILDLIDSI